MENKQAKAVPSRRVTNLTPDVATVAVAHTTALLGIEAYPVHVEVQAHPGQSEFTVIGLAEPSMRETRVRVGSALASVGIRVSEYSIVVSLVPADMRKQGGSFDLAIAAATLAATGKITTASLKGNVLLGELSLTGALRPIRGALPQLLSARQAGMTAAIVPRANEREAGAVTGIRVFVADTLQQVCDHLRGEGLLSAAATTGFEPSEPSIVDMSEVRGQPAARRALELCAAGRHHLLMIGPPGCGKTMLARRLPTILPPLTYDEAVAISAVHSVAGILPPGAGLVRSRPFRAPHHTVSEAGLVGGGDYPRPGEVSLAHLGVLFLDELTEFRRSTLDSLSRPLRDGVVAIARTKAQCSFPARPTLVGAINQCPCGYLGDRTERCHCTIDQIRAYRARLVGPLLDQVGVQVTLHAVDASSMRSKHVEESSAEVRARIVKAREIQLGRYLNGETSSPVNAALGTRELERVCVLDNEASNLLASTAAQPNLSVHAYTHVLRVARTAADLDGSDAVQGCHIAEAVQVRVLGRWQVDDR